MSHHEIEDVVESSIRILHAHDRGEDLRDVFATLFAFQAGYDASFTHARVLDLLVERRFAYRLPVAKHPRFADHAEAFGRAASDGVVFVGSEILEIETPEDEPAGIGHEHGYLVNGALYCDAGSPLWHELVAAGTFEGADAIAPKPVPLGEIALRVARVAEVVGDRDLIAMWSNFGPRTLFPIKRFVTAGTVLGKNPFTGEDIVVPEDREMTSEPTVEQLAANPTAVALRDVCRRVDAAAEEVAYDHRGPREHWSEAEVWSWG